MNQTIIMIISHYYPDKAHQDSILNAIKQLQIALNDQYNDEELTYRILLAVLKSAKSNISSLHNSIALATHDFRDLLVKAKCANDSKAHFKWERAILEKIAHNKHQRE